MAYYNMEPTIAALQKRLAYMDSELKFLWQLIYAHAKLFSQHMDAHARLLFTGLVNHRAPPISSTDALHSLIHEYSLRLLYPVQKRRQAIHFAQKYLNNIITIALGFVIGYIFIKYRRYYNPAGGQNSIPRTPKQRRHVSHMPLRRTSIINSLHSHMQTYSELIFSPRRPYAAPPNKTNKIFLRAKAFFSILLSRLHSWYRSLVAPYPHDLTAAAHSAASLLSQFGAASPANGRFTAAQIQQLDNALTGILEIRTKVRMRDGGQGMRVLGDEMMIDAGCLICFAEVVDTVLMPCRHMVICGTCSDKLSSRCDYAGRIKTAKCPVCRGAVSDKIKVFRG